MTSENKVVYFINQWNFSNDQKCSACTWYRWHRCTAAKICVESMNACRDCAEYRRGECCAGYSIVDRDCSFLNKVENRYAPIKDQFNRFYADYVAYFNDHNDIQISDYWEYLGEIPFSRKTRVIETSIPPDKIAATLAGLSGIHAFVYYQTVFLTFYAYDGECNARVAKNQFGTVYMEVIHRLEAKARGEDMPPECVRCPYDNVEKRCFRVACYKKMVKEANNRE